MMVQGLAQDIYAESVHDLVEADHYLKWARKSQSVQVIDHVTSLAANQIESRLPLAAVDGDSFLVGFDGARQVVDLRTGSKRPATRDDFITRSVGVKTMGSAKKAVRWCKFLDEVFCGNQQLIDWVQRFFGYALSGETSEQIFLFAHGLGANGKSVLLALANYIWGEYVRTIQPETLMNQMRTSSGPSPDVARLAGARLVIGSETEDGQALAESLIKQLTGDDLVTARDMYSRPFEFKPLLKLILAGNRIDGPKGRGARNARYWCKKDIWQSRQVRSSNGCDGNGQVTQPGAQ